MTQSDVVREKLRYLIIDHIGGLDHRPVQRAQDTTDALANAILSAFPALAQSDAEPVAWQYREPNGEWQMCDAATDIYYRTSKYAKFAPSTPPRLALTHLR
jgi:hypothetical protein